MESKLFHVPVVWLPVNETKRGIDPHTRDEEGALQPRNNVPPVPPVLLHPFRFHAVQYAPPETKHTLLHTCQRLHTAAQGRLPPVFLNGSICGGASARRAPAAGLVTMACSTHHTAPGWNGTGWDGMGSVEFEISVFTGVGGVGGGGRFHHQTLRTCSGRSDERGGACVAAAA